MGLLRNFTLRDKRLLTRTTLAFALVNLAICIFLSYRYFAIEHDRRSEAHASVYRQAEQAARKMDEHLAELPRIAKRLAARLEKRVYDKQETYSLIEQPFKTNSSLFGIGVAYDKFKWNPRVKLFGPAALRVNGELKRIRIENKYDYTIPDPVDTRTPRTVWFTEPMKKGAMWIPSYFGRASRTLLAGYAEPFYHPDDPLREKSPAGTVFVNFSVETVSDLVASLDLGEVGFGFLQEADGKVVAYPLEKFLVHYPDDKKPGAQFLKTIAYDAALGDQRFVRDPHSGRQYFVYYKKIPTTGWTLGMVFDVEALLDHTRLEYRLLIGMVLSFAGFLLFASIIVFRVRWDQEMHLWLISAGFSTLCTACMVAVWSLATNVQREPGGVLVLNDEGVAVAMNRHYISTRKQLPKEKAAAHHTIPTGLFVKSLKFSGPYEVKVTGYVWQKRPPDLPKEIELGFDLPEAESWHAELVYDQGGVKGWDFEADLRQPFDYADFPFDSETVWLRLWPKQLWKDVVLVPEFSGYSKLDPDSRPGLEENLVVEGWRVLKSYYSFRPHRYTTDFGFDPSARQEARLELYFNIGIKREFYSAFVSQMIALIVVAFLLFAVILTSTRKASQIELLGFNASATLQYTSALFFVLIVSHVFLRDATGAVGILYLEYFYFEMYVSILAASVNAILFSANRNIKIIDYNDNFWIKLMYWPVLLFPLLLATLYVFY